MKTCAKSVFRAVFCAAWLGGLLAGCAAPRPVAVPSPDRSLGQSSDSEPGRSAAHDAPARQEQSAAATTPGGDAAAAPSADLQQRFDAALKLMKDKQYPEATAAFEALAKNYPTLSGPQTNLGILYVQQKRPEAGMQAFRRAIAANPGNAVAQVWLGTLLRDHGNYQGAERAYSDALTARGDYAIAHYNLGVLYDTYLHRTHDAIEQYRAYLQLSGGEDLKVQAWVRRLEAAGAPAAAQPNPRGVP